MVIDSEQPSSLLAEKLAMADRAQRGRSKDHKKHNTDKIGRRPSDGIASLKEKKKVLKQARQHPHQQQNDNGSSVLVEKGMIASRTKRLQDAANTHSRTAEETAMIEEITDLPSPGAHAIGGVLDGTDDDEIDGLPSVTRDPSTILISARVVEPNEPEQQQPELPVFEAKEFKDRFPIRRILIGVLILALIIVAAVVPTVVVTSRKERDALEGLTLVPTIVDSSAPSLVPTTFFPTTSPSTANPSSSPTTSATALLDLIVTASPDSGLNAMQNDTSQHAAYMWLLGDPSLQNYTDQRLLQRYALATLAYSTFIHNDWLDYGDECSWYTRAAEEFLPFCDSEHRVQNIDLRGGAFYLWGMLPPELHFFSDSLAWFDLSSNLLYGTIPSEYASMTNLAHFSVTGNDLSGQVPSDFEALTKLEIFRVGSNHLSGPLPLFDWPRLTAFAASNNNFNGTIPTLIGNMVNLTHVAVNVNQLTGALPTELGLLTSTTVLSIQQNAFSNLPSEIGMMKSLEELYFSNAVSGASLPTEFFQLEQLVSLHGNDNDLVGTIPTLVGNLTNLQEIVLYNNEIEGTLPSEFGLLSSNYRFSIIHFASNQLTGTIPTELGSILDLDYLSLECNSLTGSVPDTVCDANPAFFLQLDCEEVSCTCCTYCCVDTSDTCECMAESQAFC